MASHMDSFARRLASETAAELIGLGKPASGPVERVLVGSVALRVLEMVRCDVLIAPEAAA